VLPGVQLTPRPSPSATLLPPYIATAQNAQSEAQATIAAAQAAKAEADLAQAFLLVTQTAASMAQTAAAGTEQSFTRQTEQSIALTATERSAQTTATAQAEATLAGQSTATAAVIQTAAAWPLTATPLAATQVAIVAQAQETERRAYWQQFVIPFWVFIGAICLTTFLILVVLTYQRLIPTIELWLRTRHGPDGETLILLEKDHGIHILQPGRNFGAALLNRPDGVQVDGIAPAGAEWQDRVVGREQAVKLAHMLPDSRKHAAKRLLTPPTPAVAQPILPAQIEIIDAAQVKPWLEEVETKLLTNGEDAL
jgi:hypothetical protein